MALHKANHGQICDSGKTFYFAIYINRAFIIIHKDSLEVFVVPPDFAPFIPYSLSMIFFSPLFISVSDILGTYG